MKFPQTSNNYEIPANIQLLWNSRDDWPKDKIFVILNSLLQFADLSSQIVIPSNKTPVTILQQIKPSHIKVQPVVHFIQIWNNENNFLKICIYFYFRNNFHLNLHACCHLRQRNLSICNWINFFLRQTFEATTFLFFDTTKKLSKVVWRNSLPYSVLNSGGGLKNLLGTNCHRFPTILNKNCKN